MSFLPVCLKIGDQPNLLEGWRFQILCFVYDEDDGAALGVLLEKEQVEVIQQADYWRGGWNTEFPVNILKELGAKDRD